MRRARSTFPARPTLSGPSGAGRQSVSKRMMVRILQEQNVQPAEVEFFASAKSAGAEVEFYGKKYRVKELTKKAMEQG
jgi:aspartate-semialdehyde dehydrogenase